MTDYHGNTHKEKEAAAAKTGTPEKKIERITSAEVIIQKKGPGRKLKEMLIAADMKSVGSYLWWDLLIPMMKNAIVDTVEQGIKRTVYGDRRAAMFARDIRNPMQSRTTYTPYNQPVLSRPYPGDPRMTMAPALESGPRASSSNISNRGYVISSKDEAEEVLEMMLNIINSYQVVTVADLTEMLGLPMDPINNRWGWNDIRTAQIRQIREGWLLELPDPIVLEP